MQIFFPLSCHTLSGIAKRGHIIFIERIKVRNPVCFHVFYLLIETGDFYADGIFLASELRHILHLQFISVRLLVLPPSVDEDLPAGVADGGEVFAFGDLPGAA